MTHQKAIDTQAAERYLLREMPELERFAFEEHLFGCQICAEDVRIGAWMEDGVKAGLLPERAEGAGQKAEVPGVGSDTSAATGAPAAAVRLSSRARPVLPWAIAATLAVAVGYQQFWTVPALRHQIIGPSVLSPVTLRGASRGAEPTLTRPVTGVISLAVDLADIAAGARLTYDLRTADGRSVASGMAAAPPPGTPLLLLIPASALDSAGRHVLSVRAGDAGSAAVDYRFTITEP